ncbi:MAG TPA: UDP-N-acetylmuramoyl-tripeptide--D-alanyl-D-alanine ligase [Bacteroidales bacterium]|nr:UDP-N-acetylmuramoyl-tripeptide--D-alanyl-D-alanine ligase [Bacteroidales bacterium]
METSQIYQLFLSQPQISIDSRSPERNSLFFALKGENHDANDFAAEALKNGASYAVVDNPEVAITDRYILVKNVLETLQQLALLHRQRFNIPLLAITGSNGKTTTKELVATVLSKKYNTLFTKRNLNNHIGLPLTLMQLNSNHQIAVIEMGANHIGEIDTLCRIALPTFGLITNIGHAHLEGFGSFEGVLAAKTELYAFIRQQLGKVFVNASDDLLMKHAANISKVTYGLNPKADYSAALMKSHPFLTLKCTENCTNFEVPTQLTGNYNATNIAAAVCIGRYFGVAVYDVVQAIADYIPANNRSQIINTGKNHLILDAYNANPSSMVVALENFSQQPGRPQMCILGDMLELGSYTDEEHKKIQELTLKSAFDRLIFVGEYFYRHKSGHTNCNYFIDTQQAKEWLAQNQFSGFNILIKGSRKIQLESLVEHL